MMKRLEYRVAKTEERHKPRPLKYLTSSLSGDYLGQLLSDNDCELRPQSSYPSIEV